jgi:hypothetical protein
VVDDQRIVDLERAVRELNRTVVGMQNALRSAANFKHEDPQKQIEGMQILIARAAEYQPRPQGRRR